MVHKGIKDIEIIYDENTMVEAEELMTIISNNYVIFSKSLENYKLSLIPKIDGFSYIKDYSSFADEVINSFIVEPELIKLFEKTDFVEIYLACLTRKLKPAIPLIEYNKTITDEESQAIFDIYIAYLYFQEKEDVSGLLPFLKYRENEKEVLLWFQNKARYPAVNVLLEVLTQCFSTDEELFKQLPQISLLTNQVITKGRIPDFENQKLPLVDLDAIDDLFLEFLVDINAPKDWIIKYQELKKNNRIRFHYVKPNSINDYSNCCKDETGFILNITDNQTIRTYISLVHEFMHYISWIDSGDFSLYFLTELPSIFFEQQFAIFLQKKGYAKNIIDFVMNERDDGNLMSALNINLTLDAIIDYTINGPINREEKIKAINEKIKEIKNNPSLYQAYLNIYQREGRKFEAEAIVDNNYDEIIYHIIKDGTMSIGGFKYLLGTILSREIRKINDPSMVSKMIKVTNDLQNITFDDIIRIFNLNIKEVTKKMVKEGK